MTLQVERDDVISIGPGRLSDLEIERLNEDLAEGWKGHRLMSLIPLIALVALVAGYLSGNVRPMMLAVAGTPMIALFLGTLFLRPYREIQTIDFSGTMDREGMSLGTRMNGKRPQVQKVKWSDVVAVEELDGRLLLYLRSGDQYRLPLEYLDEQHRGMLTTAIERSRS